MTELVRLLRTFTEDNLSAEVTLPDGKVYLAMASSVIVDGHPSWSDLYFAGYHPFQRVGCHEIRLCLHRQP